MRPGDNMNYGKLVAAYLMAGALLALLALSFVGCKTTQPVVQTRDSIRVEREIIRDTSIVIEKDSAAIRALFECDSLNRVVVRNYEILQGQRIKTAFVTQPDANGALSLSVDCKEDSLRREIALREKIIEDYSKQTQTIEVKYVPDYYKNTSTGFWILLSAIVVMIGAKFVQLYVRFKTGGLL